MRLGFVSDNFAPFIGGVETHVQQVAAELALHNEVTVGAVNFAPCRLPARLAMMHPHVLARRTKPAPESRFKIVNLNPNLLERVLMAPLFVRAIPRLQRLFYHQLNRVSHPVYHRVMAHKVRRAFAACDVMHIFAFGDLAWTVEKVARELGMPVVITPFVHPGQWGDGPSDRALYQRADRVIGLTEVDTQYLRELGVGPNRLETIGVSPNVPSTGDGRRFRARYHLENTRIVLFIGRLVPHKGSRALRDAAPLIAAEHPDVVIVFIGPPAGHAEILPANGNNVIYLGPVGSAEKSDALAACDVFCMPSMSEILPTVYLEAWQYAKPVVGGLAPGLTQLVRGNDAGLNTSQSPPEIAEAVNRMLRDPGFARGCGQAGRNLVQRKYSVTAVTAELRRTYSIVHAERGKARPPRTAREI